MFYYISTKYFRGVIMKDKKILDIEEMKKQINEEANKLSKEQLSTVLAYIIMIIDKRLD